MKKIDIFDNKMSLLRPFSRIKGSTIGNWFDGEVITKNGIVSVYSQEDYSKLDFAYKGKLYSRNYINRGYSPQFLVTLADRFSEEIIKNN